MVANCRNEQNGHPGVAVYGHENLARFFVELTQNPTEQYGKSPRKNALDGWVAECGAEFLNRFIHTLSVPHLLRAPSEKTSLLLFNALHSQA